MQEKSKKSFKGTSSPMLPDIYLSQVFIILIVIFLCLIVGREGEVPCHICFGMNVTPGTTPDTFACGPVTGI
jgi:hypothetical protein